MHLRLQGEVKDLHPTRESTLTDDGFPPHPILGTLPALSDLISSVFDKLGKNNRLLARNDIHLFAKILFEMKTKNLAASLQLRLARKCIVTDGIFPPHPLHSP